MREFKFRGRLDKASRIWLYGSLVRFDDGNVGIFVQNGKEWGLDGVEDGVITVEPETVGQFTGLKDSDENEIYEGDIIKSLNGYGVVEYVLDGFLVTWRKPKELRMINARLFAVAHENADCHVVGNVYDSPEFLEMF